MSTKWTLLVMSATDRQIFDLRPIHYGSRIYYQLKPNHVVTFTSYGGNVSFPGYPSYVKVFKDAVHYANVPVYQDMKRYWVYNESCDIDVVVMQEHLVSHIVSSQAGSQSSANGCVCGVWITGGIHSDWCGKAGQCE